MKHHFSAFLGFLSVAFALPGSIFACIIWFFLFVFFMDFAVLKGIGFCVLIRLISADFALILRVLSETIISDEVSSLVDILNLFLSSLFSFLFSSMTGTFIIPGIIISFLGIGFWPSTLLIFFWQPISWTIYGLGLSILFEAEKNIKLDNAEHKCGISWPDAIEVIQKANAFYSGFPKKFVIDFATPNDLSPEKVLNNFIFFENELNSEIIRPNKKEIPHTSTFSNLTISKLLSFLERFPRWFLYSFPDVIIWYETNKQDKSIIQKIDNIVQTEEFVPDDFKMFKGKEFTNIALLILVLSYKRLTNASFECQK